MKNHIILAVKVLFAIVMVSVSVYLVYENYIGTIGCSSCGGTLYNLKEGTFCGNCSKPVKTGNIGVKYSKYCLRCKKDNISFKFCRECGTEIKAVHIDTNYNHKVLLVGSWYNICNIFFVFIIEALILEVMFLIFRKR